MLIGILENWSTYVYSMRGYTKGNQLKLLLNIIIINVTRTIYKTFSHYVIDCDWFFKNYLKWEY